MCAKSKNHSTYTALAKLLSVLLVVTQIAIIVVPGGVRTACGRDRRLLERARIVVLVYFRIQINGSLERRR